MANVTKIGLIVRCDKSGLAAQTLRLAKLLNPNKVMIIDSTTFNGNDQNPMQYKDWPSIIIPGFPSDAQIRLFLNDVDLVISAETFYNNHFTTIAKDMGVKTLLIINHEFFDWHNSNYKYPLPDKIITPSQWHLQELKQFKAEYLPTPIFREEFQDAAEVNIGRVGKPRYLFINGKSAVHDRSGLKSLYAALELSKGDYEVVVKSQSDIPKHPDPRLTYDFTNPDDPAELYTGFDAMIHPRRYGGQSLPMCEALMSALPVIMLNVEPNNKVLPKQWLVPAQKTGVFMARTMIDIYSANPQALAKKIDVMHTDIHKWKTLALELGQQYEAENLRERYMEVLNEVSS